MFNNWLGWRSLLRLMTGTSTGTCDRRGACVKNESFGRLSAGFTQRCKDDLFTLTVSHVTDGWSSKGASMVSTQKERDWYMVSSLMTKHVSPLRRDRVAGSDRAGERSTQFRKLPRWTRGELSRDNIYIHEFRINRTTECPQGRKLKTSLITPILF